MNDYHTALQRIDAMMALLLTNQSAQCDLAEAEDAELIRLDRLKRRLKHDDTAAFNDIEAQYRAFVARYPQQP